MKSVIQKPNIKRCCLAAADRFSSGFVLCFRPWSWMHPMKRPYSGEGKPCLAWRSLRGQKMISSKWFNCILLTKQPRARYQFSFITRVCPPSTCFSSTHNFWGAAFCKLAFPSFLYLQVALCQKRIKEQHEKDKLIYANMFQKFAERDSKVMFVCVSVCALVLEEFYFTRQI